MRIAARAAGVIFNFAFSFFTVPAVFLFGNGRNRIRIPSIKIAAPATIKMVL
jgi:hypothetical protein